MGSTNISIKNEVYERLKNMKNEDESFSDFLMALTEKEKGGLENLIGQGTDYTVEELIKDREQEDFIDEEREKLLR